MPSPDDTSHGASALAELARAAWLRFDRPALERLAATAESVTSAKEGSLARSLVTLFARTAAGGDGASRVVVEAHALEIAAARAQSPRVVIEAATLAALARLELDDREGARALARRASRMARTEAMPEAEYFAHAALARVRRHDGRPHLALRILGALARIAPTPWHPWLAFETAMAGGLGAAHELLDALPPAEEDAPASHVTRGLVASIVAAARGERAAHDGALQASLSLAGDQAFIRGELADVADVVDAMRDPASAERRDVEAFVVGRGELPPRLAGIAGIDGPGGRPAGVWVLAAPGVPARRVLAPGLGLVSHETVWSATDARQLRTERAAATLLLAGPRGLARDAFFRAVYGFAWKPVTHQGVLDVLLHRVRALLEGHADMERDGEAVRVTPLAPIAVPEGGDDAPLEDRILRALAEGGALGAKEAAAAIGVPLRTVQAALARLVDEGACLAEKMGRAVAYRVEDTTFSEPTRPGTTREP